jgi:hypothetical protein
MKIYAHDFPEQWRGKASSQEVGIVSDPNLTSPRQWRRERVNKKQDKRLQVKPKNSQSETQGPTTATPMTTGQGEADICG